MFRFSVSCKEVGFMIYKLHSVICKPFSAFFFLWGNGGANWRREFDLWCLEKEAEWTFVGSKSKRSFADVVHSHPKPNQTQPSFRKSAFIRLEYPSDYHKNYLIPSANYQSQPNPHRRLPLDPPTRAVFIGSVFHTGYLEFKFQIRRQRRRKLRRQSRL